MFVGQLSSNAKLLNWIFRRTELQWGSSTLLTRLVAAKSQHLNATSPTGNEFWAWQYQSGFNTATPLYTSLHCSTVVCSVVYCATPVAKSWCYTGLSHEKLSNFPSTQALLKRTIAAATAATASVMYLLCYVPLSVWTNLKPYHISRSHPLCTTKTKHPKGIPKLRGSIDLFRTWAHRICYKT